LEACCYSNPVCSVYLVLLDVFFLYKKCYLPAISFLRRFKQKIGEKWGWGWTIRSGIPFTTLLQIPIFAINLNSCVLLIMNFIALLKILRIFKVLRRISRKKEEQLHVHCTGCKISYWGILYTSSRWYRFYTQ
jgi:hypothetical protein